tara:strand:- start:1769 stop:1963 length:195 start_codon:yes stop_codon:yes gene_type:complete
MEIEHKQQWEVFKAELTNTLTRDQFEVLCELHSIYFKHKFFRPCTCNKQRLIQWIEDLDKIYEK